jgi:hypothetical protein
MRYKVWVPDFGGTVENAKHVIVPYGTHEEAVNNFLRENWMDLEYPDPPFSVSIVEANEKGEVAGVERVFEIVEIDLDPIFLMERKR